MRTGKSTPLKKKTNDESISSSNFVFSMQAWRRSECLSCFMLLPNGARLFCACCAHKIGGCNELLKSAVWSVYSPLCSEIHLRHCVNLFPSNIHLFWQKYFALSCLIWSSESFACKKRRHSVFPANFFKPFQRIKYTRPGECNARTRIHIKQGSKIIWRA